MQKQYKINRLWRRRRNEEKEMRKRRNSHKKKKEKTKLLRRQQLLPAGVMSSCFAMTRRGGREGERNFHESIMDGHETKKHHHIRSKNTSKSRLHLAGDR
jgi:hypothetical protein